MCIQPNIHIFQWTGTHLFGKLRSLLVEINHSRIWKFQCNIYIYLIVKNFVSNNLCRQEVLPFLALCERLVKLNSTNQYLSAPSPPHSPPFSWSLDRKDCLNTRICHLKIPFIRGHRKFFFFRQAYVTYFFRLLLAYVSLLQLKNRFPPQVLHR